MHAHPDAASIANENHAIQNESIFADILGKPDVVKVNQDNLKTGYIEQLFNPYIEKRPIKVAEITFAYDNHEMIELLRQRGHYIQKERWAKYRQVEDKI